MSGSYGSQELRFDTRKDVTIAPGESYDYVGTLILDNSGQYTFKITYRLKDADASTVLLSGGGDTFVVDSSDVLTLLTKALVVYEQPNGTSIPSVPNIWYELDGPWRSLVGVKDLQIIRVAAANDGSDTLYVAVRYWENWHPIFTETIYKYSNRTWSTITDDTVPRLNINALAVAPSDHNVLYAGGDRYGIYIYENGKWSSLKGLGNFFSGDFNVRSISVDLQDPHLVYAGTSDKAYAVASGAISILSVAS